MLRNTCQILTTLHIGSSSIFEEDFEDEFIHQCVAFYRKERDRFLAANSEDKYVEYMEQKLDEERKRVKCYLDESTADRLVNVIEQMILGDNIKS